MKLRLQHGLLFVTASLVYQGQELHLNDVLLDTGSVGSVFAAETVLMAGLKYEPGDTTHEVRGVGGTEFVFLKRIDRVMVGELHVSDFEIEVGSTDYGFMIDGIVGMDCFVQAGAVIDLARLEISHGYSGQGA